MAPKEIKGADAIRVLEFYITRRIILESDIKLKPNALDRAQAEEELRYVKSVITLIEKGAQS